MEKQSILIIDDNHEALSVESLILGIEGYEVFTAQSGAEAFAVLEKIKEPDLILLDVRMDDMSGPEFLLALEQRRPDIISEVPVVFLTGMDEVPITKAVGFIKKASKMESFLKAVQHFLELSQQDHKKH